MAELTVSWAGESQPQVLSTTNYYGRYVVGTSLSVFGDGTTMVPPSLDAYEIGNIAGVWATVPSLSSTGIDAGAYTKGDDAGLYASAYIPPQQAWDWMSIVPAYSQPFQPTTITTYFWG